MSFFDQPELMLSDDSAGGNSRIETRTYLPDGGLTEASVDLRVRLITKWPTALSWELSLTATQAIALCDRIMAAAKVITDARAGLAPENKKVEEPV